MPDHPRTHNLLDNGKPLQPATAHVIEAQDVDQGIDRINLRQLKERFEALNKARLDRFYATLSSQRQQFIDLLPLLFHLNHPVLPGYISQATPCGLRDYRPSRESIKSARTLSRSFSLQRNLNPSFDICAIYVMGSCGSVAHGNHSDMDIWVCPRQDMDSGQRELLVNKCSKITEWAKEFGLDSHFFIMDDREFREQERAAMQGEDCGSTQHFLLLDEFYRTALLIAGCAPIWWLVPVKFEGEYQYYVEELRNKRFVDGNTFVDFGSARNIPVQEFLSAGIWQLYKGLDAPYKSILKLLLIEVYASEYPYTENLSQSFKQSVYNGESNVDELDPYVQIYRRLERYLTEHNEIERLELVRRCFYYKVGISLSRLGDSRHASYEEQPDKHSRREAYWRHTIIARLTRQWGWTKQDLVKLDQRHAWPLQEIKREHKELTAELNRSYRLLTGLLRNHQSGQMHSDQPASRDLTLLGRKLYAAFERKANKILRFNHSGHHGGYSQDLKIKLDDESVESPQWQIFADPQNSYTDQTRQDSVTPIRPRRRKPAVATTPLYQSGNLVETLAWCVINGLLNDKSKIEVGNKTLDLTSYEARALQSQLLQNLPTSQSSTRIQDTAFELPASVEKCLLFINAGVDPLANSKREGIHRISDHTDPLAYGSNHENLVASITLVSCNSWGEVFSYHFQGEEALDQCLVHYFSYAKPGSEYSLPERKIICACASRATAISERIEKLIDDIEKCYFADDALSSNSGTNFNIPASSDAKGYQRKRFVFESATAYHLISWHQGNLEIRQYKNEKQLTDSLSNPEGYGPLVVEPHSLKRHPLSIVARNNDIEKTAPGEPETPLIRVYYEVTGNYAETYIVNSDESLSTAKIPFDGTRTFIIQLSRFIERCIDRHHASPNTGFMQHAGNRATDTAPAKMPSLKFYRLGKTGNRYTSTLIPTESELGASYMPVQAIGTIGITGKIDWAIYCDDELFDHAGYGEEMFHHTALAILGKRSSNQAYPCYVTDIDIAGANNHTPSLARDFYYKRQLEQQLQLAMDKLAK